MESKNIIKYPVSTEKVIRLMESNNTLCFVVDLKAKKFEIKTALEELYKAKIKKINTCISSKGKKKAYVRFADDYPAIDLATQLGLM